MSFAKRLFSVSLVVGGMAMGLLGASPSMAVCTLRLYTCFHQAAEYPTFLTRAAAGLDCEIAFVGCIRRQIIGV